MSLVDAVVGLLAPHLCIACGREGSVLCSTCLETAGEPFAPRCAGCKRLTDDWRTCRSCKSWLPADRVYVSTAYTGMYEVLLRAYKFSVQRPAAKPIAVMINEIITSHDFTGFSICSLPTAPARIRERGFDHTRLLAHELSRLMKLKTNPVLSRVSNVRQLGATRTERLQQMDHEFFIEKPFAVKGKTFLLLDDVMTTGASISAASRVLKKAGARDVYAVVFAQKL